MKNILIMIAVYYVIRVVRHQYFVCQQLKNYSNKLTLFNIGLIMGLCWPLTAIYLLFKNK